MSNSNFIGQALARYSVSAMANAAEGRGVLEPGLLRFSGSGTVAGPALTADCDEGSLQAIWAAVEGAEPGAVLCVRGPGVSAYLGDLLASDLVRRGVAAVVVDGFVRDRAALSKMCLSVFARGLYPMAYRRPGAGRHSIPITIAGVEIAPGDWIVGDDDGVIAISPPNIDDVLRTAHDNEEIEAGVRSRIALGVGVADAVRAEMAARAARSGA